MEISQKSHWNAAGFQCPGSERMQEKITPIGKMKVAVIKARPPVSRQHSLRRAAAYCRVSTYLEEQDVSFETQYHYYQEKIRNAPGCVLVEVYGDQGISGLDDRKRAEFQRMMRDCENHLIDVIFVKSISRFSRNAAQCLRHIQHLKELGVEVVFEKENMSSFNPKLELALSIFASMAQEESRIRSENIRWAHRYYAEKGDPIRPGRYGYQRVFLPERNYHDWVIVEEAQVIRRLFALACQGYTLAEIGKTVGWEASRVRSCLQCEIYCGRLLTNKTVRPTYLSKRAVKNYGIVDQFYFEEHHEAIIAPEIFDRVQEYIRGGLLSGNNKKLRQKWFASHPEIAERRENA